MLLRRMFFRKDSKSLEKKSSKSPTKMQDKLSRGHVSSSTPRVNRKYTPQQQRYLPSAGSQRSGSVLQLTPLWEHILRTRTLPDTIRPIEMFTEFLERLRDAEWQVRQHALRVLVDVLVVLGPKADAYMNPIIPQLVENLGHQAPTVRKGALDCLRVYLAETVTPDTILLQILDIGLNQKITNEPFGGRLTCGVMLSLPALVQSTLHTSKRDYILQTTIEMLINKMGQVTHQEITLKVLSKIRELIGDRDFIDYMSPAAFKEFELLCNVYGVGENKEFNSTTKSWRLMSSIDTDFDKFSVNQSDGWRSSDEEKMLEYSCEPVCCMSPKEKVILETEIKINNDTLTMRILEQKDDDDIPETYPSSVEDDVVTGPSIETTGIIQVFSDSEVDEVNQIAEAESNQTTPKTPKRVTFGGEVIKVRTPDSEGTATTDEIKPHGNNNMNELSLHIPNDNTKPICETGQNSISKVYKVDSSDSVTTTSPSGGNSSASPRRKDQGCQSKDMSPRSPFKRLTINSVDNLISPKAQHKEIEVLHNLQREPSPVRIRRNSLRHEDEEPTNERPTSPTAPPKSWEELGIVDEQDLKDLISPDWRQRSNGIHALENALRSSENLALVQPCLDSLLRTLLSSERNPEVSEDKRRLLMNLISRLPLDNLEDRTAQIITGLCRQGGPGANRVSKALMQRLPPAVIVLKLLSNEFLHAKSSRFRENALQMVMYALMTFPSTCFDTNTCVTSTTWAALDRKKRVRQAALEVMAILGQVTSARVVLEIVQSIAVSHDTGNELFAAVKARLTRKQLPLISSDGSVQYTLRVPSPSTSNTDGGIFTPTGADLEWIASGVGSVSPTSLRRRAQKCYTQQHCFKAYRYSMNSHEETDMYRAPHELLALGVGARDEALEKFMSDDGTNNNARYILNKGNPLHYASMKSIRNSGGAGTNPTGTGELIGVNGKRIATKSCSDSSGDGRSSDSTYTSSSGNGFGATYTRQSMNSRFPIMERSDMKGFYNVKQSYKNPLSPMSHPVRSQIPMNLTYTKTSYPVQQRKHGIKNARTHNIPQDTFDESSFGEECNGISTSYPANGPGVLIDQTQHSNTCTSTCNKRFVNVDKLIQSNKTAIQSQPDTNSIPSSSIHATPSSSPVSVQRLSTKASSLKLISDDVNSTGTSRRTSISPSEKDNEGIVNENVCSTPKTTVVTTVESSPKGADLSSSINPTESAETIEQPPKCEEENLSHKDVFLESTRKSEESSPKKTETPNDGTQSVQSLNVDNNENADTPDYESQTITTNSRPQSVLSMKSQIIDEELEGDVASVIEPDRISEITQEVIEDLSDVDDNSVTQQNLDESSFSIRELVDNDEHHDNNDFIPDNEDIPTYPRRSPTIDEIKALSRKSSFSKSCDSLFNQPPSKQDIDNSTETSSDYQSSQLNNTIADFLPVKPQHIPLRNKSKTTYFMKSHRRVSPVKQAIKMGQPELFPQTMTRFEKPRDALHKTFDQLDSSSWEIIVMGLKSIVRLVRYHPETLDSQMHMTCIQLTKSVRNLRSQVSRAACQASTELFSIKSKNLEQECDDLVYALLHRTADTNRFLRADATRGLESMCDNLTPNKVLNILTNRGAAHQNAVVRTTTAKLLHRLAERIGYEKIFTLSRDHRDKFILTGANLLLEGSLETRSYAKALFRMMSNHPNYSRLLQEVIPPRTFRNIEKTLKSIHS